MELQLAPAAVDLITDRAQITNWRAGQRVFGPTEPEFVYFVVSGAIRLDITVGGRSSTAAFVPVGSFIGPPFLASRRQFPFSAIAHIPSLIAIVGTDTMRRALELMRPEVAYRLIALEIDRLQDLVVAKSALRSHSLEERIMMAFGALARDFGRPTANGVLIDLPLIHEDLANLVVASRANVTRTLMALRRAGTIETTGRRIVVRHLKPIPKALSGAERKPT